ncbi:MAG TPA: EAL domain-containing protein, partial [Pusillimonas sp.]|uniref:EAL domain-containing protein n=1 Tax=Pusillimonas sp. TaxID=3040095 RepID=UPI002B7EADDF
MSIHRVLVQPEVFADPRSDMARRDCLAEILHKRSLIPVFQPIIDLRLGGLIGYEGLIRGPLHGPLHMPVDLFRVAAETGRTTELEILCCQILAAQFVALSLPGKLFLNISPASLSSRAHEADLKDDLARYGLAPSDIVFELTEHSALDS